MSKSDWPWPRKVLDRTLCCSVLKREAWFDAMKDDAVELLCRDWKIERVCCEYAWEEDSECSSLDDMVAGVGVKGGS
jgi:hypothetical protein